jgi:hypothetical protein
MEADRLRAARLRRPAEEGGALDLLDEPGNSLMAP